MEEKYSVTIKCTNCGHTEIIQIPVKKAVSKAVQDKICDNCKVLAPLALWKRISYK